MALLLDNFLKIVISQQNFYISVRILYCILYTHNTGKLFLQYMYAFEYLNWIYVIIICNRLCTGMVSDQCECGCAYRDGVSVRLISDMFYTGMVSQLFEYLA